MSTKLRTAFYVVVGLLAALGLYSLFNLVQIAIFTQ